MTKNWSDISYLNEGNEKQRRSFSILRELKLLEILKDFNPIVVGTIPIAIDIAQSDIDVICSASDISIIKNVVRQYFSLHNFFEDRTEKKVYIARFEYAGMPIEIYVEPVQTNLQDAFKHMLVEERILKLAGAEFRDKVIELKEEGYKTEPAFGKLLKLKEPYTDLLGLEELSDDVLNTFIVKNRE